MFLNILLLTLLQRQLRSKLAKAKILLR